MKSARDGSKPASDRGRGASTGRVASLRPAGVVVTTAAMASAVILTATTCPAAASPAVNHDIHEVIHKMDELYRSGSSFAEVTMEIVTPHWQRTLEMKMWTSGLEKTFIRILSPRKEKGMGTLRVGNEMWNYLPKTNKVMKIPPSMMMGSWMGSDFTNDDLVNELTYQDDYTCDWAEGEDPEEGVLCVRCTPDPEAPVVWGYLVMRFRESDYLPTRIEFFDEKDRLMRTQIHSDVRTFGGRTLPSTMEMIPANKEGHRTLVRYVTADFDVDVPDDVFTLRNLRSSR
jgi:outer membrane lipoprotein-sorting protein